MENKRVIFLSGKTKCPFESVTWGDIEIFNRQGLNIRPGTIITSELVQTCSEITDYLYNLHCGFEPVSLQDLCAKKIVFSDRHLEDYLPKPLKKVCQEYLYNNMTSFLIRWDLTSVLHIHKGWQIN